MSINNFNEVSQRDNEVEENEEEEELDPRIQVVFLLFKFKNIKKLVKV